MKRRDILRSAVTAAAVAAFLASVASPAAAQTQLPDREIRIGFAAHSIDLQALFGQLREGFKSHLSEAGLKYKLFEAAPDTSSNHAQMVQNLENFATMQLDYVLVGPTSLELNEPGLMAVRDSGAKILMTDYERPKEGVPYDDAVLNWVVYSHDEMGYKAGEWLAHHFRAKGVFQPRIVMLWGPAASEISQARGGGVLRALKEAKDLELKVVYEAYANFNRELAYNETERALAAHSFDAVVGLNSYMAVSAKDALLANGKKPGEITVVGMGGTIDELQAVALGEIGVAPFRDPRSMGRASAEALLMHLTGNEGTIEKTVYADIPVCDAAYRIAKYVPAEMFDVNAFLLKHYGR